MNDMNELNNEMSDELFAAQAREMFGGKDNYWTLNRIHFDHQLLEDSYGTYGVYVQVNTKNYVTAIESSAFIDDLTAWYKVDEGHGDLYKYARVNYCPKGLMANGGYNYKLVDGVVVYAPQIEQPEDHNEMSSQEQFFIASKNYNAGELINIQGRLFEAIAAIPNGGKIIVGQNVQETTLEEYINSRTEVSE